MREVKKMSDLNMVALVGRVSQDATLKKSEKGFSVASLCFVLNRIKKIDETWEERPHFFWLNLFGKRAENLTPYLVKGQTVSIEGHLEQDRWESNGVQHSKMSLVVDTVRLIGPGKKTSNSASADSNVKQSENETSDEIDVPDDDSDPDFDMDFIPDEFEP
jgi:single-strand DNA-binding protein